MSAPANRWKLGLFVLAGAGLALAGTTALGVHGLKRASHAAWAYFDEALTGLEEGSPVRFRGVRIGVVDNIDVGADRKHLAVRMSVYDEYLGQLGLSLDQTEGGMPLSTNLRAQVVLMWVTNTAFVQVDFFPDPPSGPQQLPFECRPNTLLTVPSTAKSLDVAGREVLRELPAMAVAGRELLEMLRTDLQAAGLPSLVQRFERVLAAAETELLRLRELDTVEVATSAIATIGEVARSLRDERGPFATSLREVRALVADARAELARAPLAAATDSLRGAADRTSALAITLAGLGRDVQAELVRVDQAVAALQRLATMLEHDPGALLRGRANPPKSPLEEQRR